jgi:hypothetical protein
MLVLPVHIQLVREQPDDQEHEEPHGRLAAQWPTPSRGGPPPLNVPKDTYDHNCY